MSSPEFQPSCPQGGQWFACGNGAQFVGCCTSNPCTDAGCSAGNLRPASFNPAYWGTEDLPDQQCASTAAKWWSCTGTDPPFVGCCVTNACANTTGCPESDLIQGVLSNVPSQANHMDPHPPLQATSSDTSSASSTTSTSTSTNSNSTASDIGSDTNASIKISTGVTVGSVVGGVAFLVVAISLLWYMIRRKKSKQVSATSTAQNDPTPPALNEKYEYNNSTLSALPSYTAAPTHTSYQPYHRVDNPSHRQSAGTQSHISLVDGTFYRQGSTVSGFSTSTPACGTDLYGYRASTLSPLQELDATNFQPHDPTVSRNENCNQDPVELASVPEGGLDNKSTPSHR